MSKSIKIFRVKPSYAFTLVELAAVLMIIGVIMGSLLVVATNKSEADKIKETEQKMQEIEKYIAMYVAEYGSIPCVADATLATANANFGVTTRNWGHYEWCNGTASGYWSWDYPYADIGSVPTKTLKIPDDYAFDAWGRRFTYAMIEFCNASNIQHLAGYSGNVSNPDYWNGNTFSGGNCGGGGATSFTIRNAAGGTITNKAVYVLLSHGKNGHGAFPYNGGGSKILGVGNVSSDEVTNALYTTGGANQLSYGIYIQKSHNFSNTTNNFDDIVHYRTKEQIISEAKALNKSSKYSSFLCNMANSLVNTADFNDTTKANNVCGPRSDSNCANYLFTLAKQIYRLCL